jgi:hypothetical protein
VADNDVADMTMLTFDNEDNKSYNDELVSFINFELIRCTFHSAVCTQHLYCLLTK